MTKYKIGIFGSNTGAMNTTLPVADELGRILGEHASSVILITGGFGGIPYQVAKKASALGSEVWGFSEAQDETGQRKLFPGNDLSLYNKISYLPPGFPFLNVDRACKKYRNVLSIANCDAGIIISGRWGSLNEFTNLIDLQKVVGVLIGTGGVADELPKLARKISKDGQGDIIFESDPKILIKKILEKLKITSKTI